LTVEKSYWNNCGRYEELNKKLHARIDEIIAEQGEESVRTRGLKGHPKLEKLRRAKAVYYDIFNNGGGNRMQAIFPIFGIRMSRYKIHYAYQGRLSSRLDFDAIMRNIEPVMDKLILAAAVEQEVIETAN
jgi:Txe/YoeB family toxin of Txe-Axe toxin-antitoxin module